MLQILQLYAWSQFSRLLLSTNLEGGCLENRVFRIKHNDRINIISLFYLNFTWRSCVEKLNWKCLMRITPPWHNVKLTCYTGRATLLLVHNDWNMTLRALFTYSVVTHNISWDIALLIKVNLHIVSLHTIFPEISPFWSKWIYILKINWKSYRSIVWST